MILPGTENLRRYPHISGSVKMGIEVYGTTKDGYGRKIYKIPLPDLERVNSLGWQTVKEGRGYAYVARLDVRNPSNPKVSPPFVHRGEPRAQTVYRELLAKKYPDDTVVAWQNEQTALVSPSRHTFVYTAIYPSGKRSGIGPMMQIYPRELVPPARRRNHFWDMSQFYYYPGERLHVNGQFLQASEDTYKKNIAELRKDGFKRVSQDKLGEMLPASFRSPWSKRKGVSR